MTHTPPQPATAATAVAIGLAKDSELLHSLLQLLWLCSLSLFFFFLFFVYLCSVPVFVLVCQPHYVEGAVRGHAG